MTDPYDGVHRMRAAVSRAYVEARDGRLTYATLRAMDDLCNQPFTAHRKVHPFAVRLAALLEQRHRRRHAVRLADELRWAMETATKLTEQL